MSPTRTGWFSVPFCVVCFASVGWAETPKLPAAKDFAGKYVVIACSAGPSKNLVLGEATVQALGTKHFLVGKVWFEDGANGDGTAKVWLNLADVNQIREFADKDKAVDAARRLRVVQKPEADDVLTWKSSAMSIPIDYNPAKKDRIDKLILYTSADRGKTWTKHSEAGVEAENFRYDADRNGEVWFALQIVNKDGSVEPKTEKLNGDLKVRFAIERAEPANPLVGFGPGSSFVRRIAT